MVFGEIIEPTTRALIIDDELEELPEYQKPVIEWEGDPSPPDNIETLVFVETQKVVHVCTSITKEKPPIVRLRNEGLTVYKFKENYLVVFDGNNRNLVLGEMVELLLPWITKAKSVHAVTSSLISTFQPMESLIGESAITFTRCLTNLEDVPYNFCKRLETPNLVKDFGATVFTYCIHNNIKSTLWVVYTDNMPLDSVNSSEIVRLLNTLGFEVKVVCKGSPSVSNLYM